MFEINIKMYKFTNLRRINNYKQQLEVKENIWTEGIVSSTGFQGELSRKQIDSSRFTSTREVQGPVTSNEKVDPKYLRKKKRYSSAK